MKNLLFTTIAALSLVGCTFSQSRSNPYEKPQFYSRYLASNNALDQRIQRTVDSLRANPRSATLHNDLGALLVQKGFPKDATVEFERALDADRKFYPAWYNLGLIRAAENDYPLAHHAFSRTVHFKPGHAAALFQLGLLEEKYHHDERAIEYLAKAFAINRSLLDVRINPRILDSRLVPLALLKLYPKQHVRESLLFQGTPPGYDGASTDIVATPASSQPQAAPTTPPPPTPIPVPPLVPAPAVMPPKIRPAPQPPAPQPPAPPSTTVAPAPTSVPPQASARVPVYLTTIPSATAAAQLTP